MNKAVVVAGAAAVALALPLLGIMGFGSEDQANAVSSTLNANAVPAAYQQVITRAAQTCSTITGPLLASQIEQESGWNPAAKSPAGAEGISQFMPSTWAVWAVHADPNTVVADIWDPVDAIMTQARYDCALAAKVNNLIADHKASGDVLSLTLAAYNAGIGAVEQYGGIPPFPETEHYVAAILAGMAAYTATAIGSTTGFGAKVIAAASHYIGTPYSWGGGSITGPTLGVGEGAGTDGFDCSGLTLYAVYQASGGTIVLPHSSEQQATMGTPETMATIEPGDLIAIQTDGPGDYSHIVIYEGNGMILEAPKTGETVRSAPLSEYAGMVQTIRRIA